MTHSPYRQTERPSIVVHGEPSTTTFLWAIWVSTAVLVVTALVVYDLARARIVLLVTGAFVVVVAALLHHAARRVRWQLTLDGVRLHVQRRAVISSQDFILDVQGGVRLGLGVVEGLGRVDQCIVFLAGSRRFAMTTGVRPADTLERVAAFLRDHGVVVTDLPAGPVGWSAGTGTA